MAQLELAGCIVRNNDGEILLLHRNTPKRQQWEIPGGKLDPFEDAKKTAIREVREEAGIEVEILCELGSKSFVEDTHTMLYTWFLAEVIGGDPSIQEPSVHDKWRYFSLPELRDLDAELSPNARNFVHEVSSGRVTL
jgi:8-oxo-dGTP diphosphatase